MKSSGTCMYCSWQDLVCWRCAAGLWGAAAATLSLVCDDRWCGTAAAPPAATAIRGRWNVQPWLELVQPEEGRWRTHPWDGNELLIRMTHLAVREIGMAPMSSHLAANVDLGQYSLSTLIYLSQTMEINILMAIVSCGE